MQKILFIGSFLSGNKGSLSVSENVAKWLGNKVGNIQLVSYQKNKLARILDIIFTILVFKGKCIQIEVYSGTAFYITFLAVRIAKLRNKKVLLNLHGGKLPEFTSQRTKLVVNTLKSAEKIVSPSNYLIEYFKKYNIEVTYLPNPFDTSNFRFEKKNEKKFSLLWVRAFDEIYQPELAVYILLELLKRFPESHLTMVGPDHGKKNEITKLISRLDLSNHVTIVGPVNNTELSKYYQSHQVYINTTRYESFGVSLIEAASCGIAIVSNPVGEIPLLWEHGKNILLADLNNPRDFASKIELLFSDEETYHRLTENARNHTTQFHWNKLEHKWLNLLQQ